MDNSKKDKPAKKRSIYNQKSMLELPEWAKKDKAHAYRWTTSRQIARSDGYDPRGWELAKDPVTGEILKAYDVTLARLPIDEHEEMKSFKEEQRKNQIKQVSETMASRADQLRYEVEKVGGTVDFDFKKER